MVTSAACRMQDRESSPVKDQRSTVLPPYQPTNQNDYNVLRIVQDFLSLFSSI